MLGPDSLIQSNSGFFTGTSGSASVPAGVAADSTVVLILTTGGVALPTSITGFTRTTGGLGTSPVSIYYRNAATGLAAGETSWSLTITSGAVTSWVVLELAGLDAASNVDVVPATAGSATSTSVSTGTTPLSSTYDGLAVAAHSAYQATGGVAPTISGHTNNLSELVEQGGTDGTKAIDLSVSWLFTQSLGTFSSTATQTGASSPMGGNIVVFTAAGARRAADVQMCAGFEIGSTTGLTATGNATPYADSATNATVETAAARTGTYGARLQGTAVAANVQWNTALIVNTVGVVRVSYRFRSALPGADLDLATFGGHILRFRQASGLLGLQHSSGGTEQLSDLAITAGQWFSVDLRSDHTTTTWAADWQVTYSDGGVPVVQGSLSTAGQTAGSSNGLVLGWTGALTGNVDVDDVVVSKTSAHYPLGDMRIYPLLVDPAGTPSISGTAANFNTFTANGTMAAWNATTARGAIDEIPPVIGASADGVAQVTAATVDYMEFPCQTVDLAAVGGMIRAARVCVAGWAAAATTATIGLFAYDGGTEYVVAGMPGTTDPGWDNAAELWACGMVKPTGGRIDWSAAKLDALTVRVGKSSDATPDIGIHAFVVEAVVRKSDLSMVLSAETNLFRVDAYVDPDSSGVLKYAVTSDDPNRGATLTYDIAGTPQTAVYCPPAATVNSPGILAADFTTVTRVELTPDPAADQPG